MIDHPHQLLKPVTASHLLTPAAAAVRCHGNRHDVTLSRDDAAQCDGLGRVGVGARDAGSVVPRWYAGDWPRPVDDPELAADAEVCWLLRHAAATAAATPLTPLTPEMEPALGGLRIGAGDDVLLTACVAPDLDSLPPYLATLSAVRPCCGLRPPSGAAYTYYDARHRPRPCLNLDKMQV